MKNGELRDEGKERPNDLHEKIHKFLVHFFMICRQIGHSINHSQKPEIYQSKKIDKISELLDKIGKKLPDIKASSVKS